MRLLVFGLGNPGDRYAGTRHNAGFRVVDELCAKTSCELHIKRIRRYALGRLKVGDSVVHLAKPFTFMNNSGEVLGFIFRETGLTPEELLVVCDNMDLPPGMCRLKQGGGDAGNNGLKSVIKCLGTGEFLRLYLGIGRPLHKSQVVSHVLGSMDADEEALMVSCVQTAADAVLGLPEKGFKAVMNEINKKNRP